MKQVGEMPTEGQFVAVWIYNGEVWSVTCKYDKHGHICTYSESTDEFDEYPRTFDNETKFFITD